MSSNSIATLESLIKCSICLDNYDDPRCLPCSHTYCYKCIEKLCEDGIGQCPMRDNTIFFQDTINKFPINRIAKDLVEYLNEPSSSETKCDHCKQILSEFFCKNCSKSYCTICLKLKHDLNEFKTHQINIVINEKNSNEFCFEHNEEKLKYWCNQCQQLVCSDCLLFKHKQHSFSNLKDIAENIKKDFNSSINEINQMKINLEKLNKTTNESCRKHYQTHCKTKSSIEEIFNDLETILKKRKKYFIRLIDQKQFEEQKLIEEQKSNIEENIKIILIRQLFLEEILKTNNYFKFIQIKNDFLNYNQIIQQQYQQLFQTSFLDFHYFHIDQHYLLMIQQDLKNLGKTITETFSIDENNLHPLIKLADFEEDEKSLELNENYAYGYRFDLNKPLKINAIRIKVKLLNNDLSILILDYNDILIYKKTFEINISNSSTFNWITIPINYLIKQNSYIFLWSQSQSNEHSKSLIAYKESNNNLRKINENISVRSKRLQIDKSTNIQLNEKLNVIYDTLLNNNNEKDKSIPAIQIILDI